MSNLEDLVPPLELCMKIPDGAFADSGLVWWKQNEGNKYHPELWLVVERESTVEGEEIYPAPTLAEIMEAFQRADFATSIFSCGVGWIAKAIKRNINEFKWDENPATAALELWLELNERKEKK